MKSGSHIEIAGILCPDLRGSCVPKRGRDTQNHATRKSLVPICYSSFTTAFNFDEKYVGLIQLNLRGPTINFSRSRALLLLVFDK
jgi:hypothetical protein